MMQDLQNTAAVRFACHSHSVTGQIRLRFIVMHWGVSFFFYTQDPHAEEFEDKEWTFVIENVSTNLSSQSFNCCVYTDGVRFG